MTVQVQSYMKPISVHKILRAWFGPMDTYLEIVAMGCARPTHTLQRLLQKEMTLYLVSL